MSSEILKKCEMKCVELIKNDKVAAAFSEAQSATEWVANSAGRCLVELQLLLFYKRPNKSLISTAEDVFRMAEFCCSAIRQHNYDYDSLKMLKCLCCIINFLLEKQFLYYAKDLCKYVVEIMKNENIIKLEDSVKETFLNHYSRSFSKALFNADIKSLLESEQDDEDNLGKDEAAVVINSLIAIWKFNFNLRKIKNNIYISDLIAVLGNYVKNFQSVNKYAIKYLYSDGLLYILNDINANNITVAEIDDAFIKFSLLTSVAISSAISFNQIDDFAFLFSINDLFASKYLNIFNGGKLIDGNSSDLKNDICITFNILTLILNKICVLSKEVIFKNFIKCNFKIALRAQETCLLWIDAMIKAECSLTEQYLLFVVPHCINLQIGYGSLEMYDKCLILSKQLCKFVITLPKAEFNKLNGKAKALEVLTSYYYYCKKIGKPRDGLIGIVAWSTADSSYEFLSLLSEMLSTFKFSRHCPPDVMNVTIFDIINEDKEILCNDWGINSVLLSNIDWSPFILLEVHAYHRTRSLQGEPLLKAAKSLLCIKPAPDNVTIAQALILAFDAMTKNVRTCIVDDELRTAFDSVTGKLMKKKNKTNEEICVLGNLLHCSVRFDVYSARKNTESALIKYTVKDLTPKLDATTGLPTDLLDSFDAQIIDSALLLSNQDLLIEKLDNALKYIKNSLIRKDLNCEDINITGDVDFSCLQPDLILMSLNNMIKTAQLYRLFCEYKRALDIWHLLYDICYQKYPDVALNAFTNILSINGFSGTDIQLFNKVKKINNEAILSFLQKESESLDLSSAPEVVKMFFLQLAMHYLHQLKLNDVSSLLRQLSFTFTKNIPYIKYLLVVTKFLVVSNSELLWAGEPSTTNFAIHKLSSVIRFAVHQFSWDDYNEQCEIQRMLFEIGTCASQYYCNLLLPNYAYLHLKEELIIAQKLALPLWTCRLLVSLSWIDVTVYKLDDCELKLRSIEVILGLKTKIQAQLLSPIPVYSDGDDGYYRKTDDFCLRSTYNINNASPMLFKDAGVTLYLEDTVFSACKNVCSMCIFVDIIILRATVLYMKNSYTISATWFKYARKQIHNLSLRRDDDILMLKDWLVSREAMLYLHYAVLLDFKNDFHRALKYYKKSKKCFESGASQLYTHAVTSADIELGCINLELKMCKAFRDTAKTDCTTDTTGSLPVSVSIKTPPISKLTVCVTPLSHKCVEQNKRIITPGDIPHLFKGKKLFSDNDDSDNVDSNSEENCTAKRQEKLYKGKQKDKLPSFVSKIPPLHLPENKIVNSPVNEIKDIIKSVSKIAIYDDRKQNFRDSTATTSSATSSSSSSLSKIRTSKRTTKNNENKENKTKFAKRVLRSCN
ncbi:uncharacterized protein LOC142321110 [Lycorma delicatula]|uniref:uncharacterized protein LOC142321110 n=1 Tax=Lycorma delicatula TaxID=130591 RepID=UPI003F5174E8